MYMYTFASFIFRVCVYLLYNIYIYNTYLHTYTLTHLYTYLHTYILISLPDLTLHNIYIYRYHIYILYLHIVYIYIYILLLSQPLRPQHLAPGKAAGLAATSKGATTGCAAPIGPGAAGAAGSARGEAGGREGPTWGDDEIYEELPIVISCYILGYL